MATATLLQRKTRSVRIGKAETLLILRAYQAHPTSWSEVLEDVRQNVNLLPNDAKDLYQSGSLKKLRDRMSGKFGKLLSSDQEAIADLEIRNEVRTIVAAERRLVHRTGPPDAVQQYADQAIAGPAPPIAGPAPPIAGPAPPIAGPAPPIAGPAPPIAGPAPPIAGPAPPIAGPAPPVAGPALPLAVPAIDRRDVVAQNMSDSDEEVPIQANAAGVANEQQHDQPQHPGRAHGQQRPRKRSLASLIRSNHEAYDTFITKKMPRLLRLIGLNSSDDDDQ